MTDFAASWLDLREPVDHRSRNTALARALSAQVGGREELTIADLGCGTGCNLRASAPLLPPAQRWTLIDASQELLAAAVDRLQAWADQADWEGETLLLAKGGKHIRVDFRRADLARDLDAVLGHADLVAASALFDLVSADFIGRFAASLARRRSAFYGVLTYDGRQAWTPACEADADLLAPPSMMRVWAAHLKNYEFATVPESGHSIAWEQPQVFNEKVLAFIARH